MEDVLFQIVISNYLAWELFFYKVFEIFIFGHVAYELVENLEKLTFIFYDT